MILPSGLQYTLKRVGPKTDPCGTPYLTRLQQERELFTFTEVVQVPLYSNGLGIYMGHEIQRKKSVTLCGSRVLANLCSISTV